MFQDLLKKAIFVLCASISATACLAMELEKDDFSKLPYKRELEESFVHGPQNIFNAMRFYMGKSENPSLFLSQIFQYWPEKIRLFEDQLEQERKETFRNSDLTQVQFNEKTNTINCTINEFNLKITEDQYLEALLLLNKSIIQKLDLVTLNNLGHRNYKISFQTNDLKKQKKFLSQAIWFSIIGAKSGCEYSYNLLKKIITGEVNNKTEYTTYYTFLINFLLQGDSQAQNLFIRVALDSVGAFNWVKQYVEKLEQNEKEEAKAQLKVLNEAMVNFNQAQGKQWYDTAMQLRKDSPSEAINYFLKAENSSIEAKEELEKLRKSTGYLNSKNAKKNDHGRLLKEKERELGTNSFNTYRTVYVTAELSYKPSAISSSRSRNAINTENPLRQLKGMEALLNHLNQAVEMGNPQALEEHKKLLGKATSKPTNFEANVANAYKLFLENKKNSSTASMNPVKMNTRQNSNSAENTTTASTTATLKLPEKKKESNEQGLAGKNLYEVYCISYNNSSSVDTLEDAAACLYEAIIEGNSQAIEELEKLEKSENPKDIRFILEYKNFENFAQKTGVVENSNLPNTNNTNSANNTNSIALTATSSTIKIPDEEKEFKEWNSPHYETYKLGKTHKLNPQATINSLYRAICSGDLRAIEELKKLEKSENPEDITFMREYNALSEDKKGPLSVVEATKTPTTTTTTDAKLPGKSQETVSLSSSSKGTEKPNNTNSANITNSIPVIEVPQKTEEEKEDFKSPESAVVEKTKHHKHRTHREKTELPNQDHLATSSREESHDFTPMPIKKHRHLHRADSVRELPKERPTLKRTASLGQMPKVVEPTPDTHKKSKTLSLKKGLESLLLKKKATPLVEKKDSSSSHSKKSSSHSKSGVSEEELSKSEESHSRSKKKGSSAKPLVNRSLFFASDKVREDYMKLSEKLKKPNKPNKLDKLLDLIKADPFGDYDWSGKPELLKENYAGCWSRHINKKHRIVYSVEPDDRIKILEVGEHYQRS